MEDFELQFIQETLEEISDHLDAMDTLISNDLDINESAEQFDHVLRLFHSIKGNAQCADLNDIAYVSHLFETLLLKIQSKEIKIPTDLMNESIFQFHHELIENVKKVEKDLNYDMDLFSLSERIQALFEVRKYTPVKSNKPRVLIVDDEDDIRTALKLQLVELGDYDIDFAANGEEALMKAKSNEYTFLITDYSMPMLNGLDLTHNLRKGNGPNRKTPIIFLTAYSPNVLDNEHLLQDVYFLQKPYTPKRLKYFIKCCLVTKKAAA